MAYIYMIENDINEKKYIGKTNFDIQKRFQEHLKDSTRRRKEKRPLYNAITKYGKEHFSIKLLEEVSIEDAPEREKYWITFYNSFEKGYNATLGGDGKSYVNHKQILQLYDTTSLSQEEIAIKCDCSTDTVSNIVKEYRSNVDWVKRYGKRNITNNLGIHATSVRCIETGEIFHSATSAANWLVTEGKIKSQGYGRSKIPEVCRGIRKTVGSYSWEFDK